MRRLKALCLAALVFVCLLLICSCTCDPSQHEWGILEIVHDVNSANGQTIKTTTTSYAHSLQPLGISSDDVNIIFHEDGRVEFKPYESDILYGYCTIKHNGIQDTDFTITFENGEKTENGRAVSFYGGRELSFVFRGVTYYFTDGNDTLTSEELNRITEWNVECARDVGYYFYRGMIVLNENGGKLSSEGLDEDLDLFAEGFLVNVVHISTENELTAINELRDGECVFAYSRYSNQVVIYYVDPLPNESLPGEPIEYTIFDIIPDLEYYFRHSENALLKLTREQNPSKAGEFNEHIYENESSEIEFWLSRLAEITLVESDSPPYDIHEQHIKYNMKFEDKTKENNCVIIYYECGMIRIDDKWYDCSTFPTWYGGRKVYSFSCMNYSMYVWGGGIRYFAIDGIEFMPDQKQDYEYPAEYWTLRLDGEVGEIIVYDETHFYYNGIYYVVTSEKNFCYIYS